MRLNAEIDLRSGGRKGFVVTEDDIGGGLLVGRGIPIRKITGPFELVEDTAVGVGVDREGIFERLEIAGGSSLARQVEPRKQQLTADSSVRIKASVASIAQYKLF